MAYGDYWLAIQSLRLSVHGGVEMPRAGDRFPTPRIAQRIEQRTRMDALKPCRMLSTAPGLETLQSLTRLGVASSVPLDPIFDHLRRSIDAQD
jgi:hypothetical protein